MNEKSIHAFFSGMVQGVGFRFTALNLARKQKLKGWVKNLADGRVELLVEGSGKNLGIFINDLRCEFEDRITDSELSEGMASGDFSEFKILF